MRRGTITATPDPDEVKGTKDKNSDKDHGDGVLAMQPQKNRQAEVSKSTTCPESWAELTDDSPRGYAVTVPGSAGKASSGLL